MSVVTAEGEVQACHVGRGEHQAQSPRKSHVFQAGRHVGFKHDAFVNPRAVFHLEILFLRAAVFEAVVEVEIGERAQITSNEMEIRVLAKVNQIDSLRAFGLLMHEKIVRHDFASVQNNVADAEIHLLRLSGSGFLETQDPAFVKRKLEMLIRPCGVDYGVEDAIFVGVDANSVVVEDAVLGETSRRECHPVELAGNVEICECVDVVVKKRSSSREDESFAELLASHREVVVFCGSVEICVLMFRHTSHAVRRYL